MPILIAEIFKCHLFWQIKFMHFILGGVVNIVLLFSGHNLGGGRRC